jgi:chorismate dehydratase
MEKKVKVSVVSYLNSKPFVYGLQHSELLKKIDLSLDIPSTCASKLENGLADVGLVPLATLLNNPKLQVVGGKCIASDVKVRTVVLASKVPLDEIETILLDYQSRSSVMLTRVLSKFFWKKNFLWENTSPDFENQLIGGKTAGVVIGDRVFNTEKQCPYIYDLCEEWRRYTGLPFVFAVWAANRRLPVEFVRDFEKALEFGIGHIEDVIKEEEKYYPGVNLFEYFTENIKFNTDAKKREAISLFLDLAGKL